MASEEALNLARGWLGNCQAHHDRCNAAGTRIMPSRVIEINWIPGALEPSLKLLSNPQWENYAVLSYCWGGDQPMKTTALTLQHFSEAISFSDLPKSLRDAVLITWRLSLRFLWVDSLCIVQDDSGVVAREIALMPEIYQNAHVTLSAARSSSSKEGFLHDLLMPSVQAEVFKLLFSCPDGIVGSVILFHEPDFWDPIERRAWPLQEFLLSRRILKYGSYQLSWSCLSAEYSENNNAEVNWFSKRDSQFLNLRRQFLDWQKDMSSYYNVWRKLVREYSSRSLTEPADRPLAISGIATAMASKRNERYLAGYLGGLWLGDLPAGLLWEVVSSPQPRSRGYRAPSWSWTSVDGTIEWLHDGNIDPRLRILAYEVTPTELTAPYGALSAGYIKILGHVRSAYWIKTRQTLVDITPGDNINTQGLAYTREDVDDGVATAPILVWCLLIFPYNPILDKGPSGLILTGEGEGVFRRAGTFHFDLDVYRGMGLDFQNLHREKQLRWTDECRLQEIIIK
jgi:hypothetical protein